MCNHSCVYLVNRKKVLFLITGLGHGGAETQVVRVACELKKRGWIVSIVTMLEPESDLLLERLKTAGIEIESLGFGTSYFSSLRVLPKLQRILVPKKPYVLCSFLFHANILGQFARHLADIPRYITSIRGASFGSPKRIKFASFFHQFDDLTTLNSQKVADYMVGESILEKEKIEIIHNAISLEDYQRPLLVRKREREKLKLNEGTFLFIALGRVHPVKGYDYLVDACSKIEGDFRLIIVGKNDDNSLARRIEKSKLNNKITLLGFRKDVANLLAASDALVLSSISEGLPNAVIEAHAAGLPVISTDVGGVKEIIVEGKSGITLAPKNARALAGAMQTFIESPPQQLREMGAIGRAHIEDTFGLDKVVDRWEEILLGVHIDPIQD